jgi:hypothetical protein
MMDENYGKYLWADVSIQLGKCLSGGIYMLTYFTFSARRTEGAANCFHLTLCVPSYYTYNTFTATIMTRIRQEEHVQYMGKIRNAYNILERKYTYRR